MAANTFAMNGNSPFRFLDLPKELRLMVYEWIPFSTRHYVYHTRSRDGNTPNCAPNMTLIVKNPGTAIACTSRLTNAESKAIFEERLRYLKNEPLRVVINIDSNVLRLSPHRHEIEVHQNIFQHAAMLLDKHSGRSSDYEPYDWPPAYFESMDRNPRDDRGGYGKSEMRLKDGSDRHLIAVRFIESLAMYIYTRKPSRIILSLQRELYARNLISRDLNGVREWAGTWTGQATTLFPRLGLNTLEWALSGCLDEAVPPEWVTNVASFVKRRPRQQFLGLLKDEEWVRDWAESESFM